MEAEFRAALPEVMTPLRARRSPRSGSGSSPAVKFDPDLIACVRHGAEQAGYPMRDMVSGAGHDSAYIARVAPTTMIFVPCKGGISHNEEESATLEECAAGAQVLLNAVLEYDRRFAG